MPAGYGPETVTMRTAKRGTYYYYVNKYSGVSNIKESQGEVKVSQCGTPPATEGNRGRLAQPPQPQYSVRVALRTACRIARSTARSVSHSAQRVRRASADRVGRSVSAFVCAVGL